MAKYMHPGRPSEKNDNKKKSAKNKKKLIGNRKKLP